MEILKLPINEIKANPNNPRIIKDEKYQKLLQSIKDFPEMTEAREVILNKDHIILGGNMRFKAMQEAGWTEIPVKIVDWSEEKQRRFVIQDNINGGEWDWETLANEWDSTELGDWGINLPDFDQELNNKEVNTEGLLDDSKTVTCPRCKFEFEP